MSKSLVKRGRNEYLTEKEIYEFNRLALGGMKALQLGKTFNLSTRAAQARRSALVDDGFITLDTYRSKPQPDAKSPSKAVLPQSPSEWIAAPTRERLMSGR